MSFVRFSSLVSPVRGSAPPIISGPKARALVGASLIGLAGASAASAADLYAPRRERAPVLQTFDATPWTGAYVGLSVGRSWGTTGVDTLGGNLTFDTNGGQFAGNVGYTVQSGIFVLGGEAELAAGRLSGSGGGFTQDLNWMGAVRARAGVLLTPPLYIYALAGLAWADMSFTAGGLDRGQNFAGFQVGAGAEYRFSRNWSLRLDYIYTDFGGERRDFPTGSQHVDPNFSTVRAGVNFRF